MRQQHLESGGQLSPDLAADAHTTSSNAGRKKNRLILYESTAPATSWPKCPRTPKPRSRPTIGRSSQVPATVEPGPAAVRPVQNRIDSFARRWRDSYPAAGALPARRPRQPHRLPALPPGALESDPALQLPRADLWRDRPPGEGHRPAARRAQLHLAGLGGPGPGQPRLARLHHDPRRAAAAARPAPGAVRPADTPGRSR